ncbi:MAG: hypothetical protein Q9222_004275 [Ikaeria aurantiellina]
MASSYNGSPSLESFNLVASPNQRNISQYFQPKAADLTAEDEFIVIASESESTDSEDHLPNCSELLETRTNRNSQSAIAYSAQSGPRFPLTPASIPRKLITYGSNTSQTPKTPTRRPLRPNRGNYHTNLPTPTRSHKRVRSDDSDDPIATSYKLGHTFFTAVAPTTRSPFDSTAINTSRIRPSPNSTPASTILPGTTPSIPSPIRTPITARVQHQPSSSSSSTTIKPSNQPGITPLELERLREFMMKNVDWKAVGVHVSLNRKAGFYKRAMLGMMDRWMRELTAEDEGEL